MGRNLGSSKPLVSFGKSSISGWILEVIVWTWIWMWIWYLGQPPVVVIEGWDDFYAWL